MTQRARKFIGAWIIIAWLIAYPLCISVLYTGMFGWLPVWATILSFLFAGLFWAVPAGLIIRWMAKPDPKQSEL